MWRRAGTVAAGLVLVVTALVAVGVAQGSPPHALPISPGARAREIAAVAKAGPVVAHGQALFDDHGCADCHTMAAGGYEGLLGPRLDVQAQGDKVKDILQNIAQPPDDDKGYEAGLMPENFGKRLSKADLHALAVYIHTAATAAAGKKSKSGS
jgi:mono/diheme cytochrome c family protein